MAISIIKQIYKNCGMLNIKRTLIFIGEEQINAATSKVQIPEDPKLPQLDQNPKVTKRINFSRKRRIDFRGPEPTVNYLLLRKCGIQATSGGRLKFEHIEEIRKH